MRFQLKDTNRFPMPGDSRFEHRATISYGLREFVAFVGRQGTIYEGKCFIEEAVLSVNILKDDVTGHLKFIDDDNLVADLASFLQEKKVLSLLPLGHE